MRWEMLLLLLSRYYDDDNDDIFDDGGGSDYIPKGKLILIKSITHSGVLNNACFVPSNGRF